MRAQNSACRHRSPASWQRSNSTLQRPLSQTSAAQRSVLRPYGLGLSSRCAAPGQRARGWLLAAKPGYELAPDELFQVPSAPTSASSQELIADELEDEVLEERAEPVEGWLRKGASFSDSDDRERVYLVGASLKRDQQTGSYNNGSSSSNGNGSSNGSSVAAGYGICESLEELGRLADTAGLRVMGSTYQILEFPNNATYIGSGKVAQVARAVRALNIETVIFDDELSPGQLRNLEKAMNSGDDQAPRVKVCDRTALILDIFSQRAATKEGKLQVELAQTEYQLPRLTRMWSHLDRVGGGGQVKGTGEKQIETDKRLLRDRVAQLRRELETVRTHRRNYRERRNLLPVPVVALVGYTNAGKSTLLNTLTQADVLAEDKLFATLDPTTRKIRLKGNKELLISDTVGFIQKLPTELVAAFRATLEEIQDASILLHLVDISHPQAQAQSEAVCKVLADLNVGHIPLITAWNKVDRCPDPDQVRAVAASRPDPTYCISGQTGEGLPELLSAISSQLASVMEEVEVKVPYAMGDLIDLMHSTGEVVDAQYGEDGVLVRARVPPSVAGRLQPFSLAPVAQKPKRQRRRDVWTEEEQQVHEVEQLL